MIYFILGLMAAAALTRLSYLRGYRQRGNADFQRGFRFGVIEGQAKTVLKMDQILEGMER